MEVLGPRKVVERALEPTALDQSAQSISYPNRNFRLASVFQIVFPFS